MSKKVKEVVTAEVGTEVAPAVVIPTVPNQAAFVYVLGEKAPAPRTEGAALQASNTKLAWNTVAGCLQENNGQATRDQLVAALEKVGLTFKTYVPYFTTKCRWLAIKS